MDTRWTSGGGATTTERATRRRVSVALALIGLVASALPLSGTPAAAAPAADRPSRTILGTADGKAVGPTSDRPGAPPDTSDPTTSAPVVPDPLTSMDHLAFLGDEVVPPDQDGHTTHRLDTEPTIGVLWTYADRRDDGTYERIGGGTHDPVTDTWGQGAFNADDVSRAAVAWLRHHRLFDDPASLQRARQLLRGLTYMQTATGPNAGNVVLWMQPDGTLNPSAEPVELPDPSDSADSYWLARTIWALGEGYATFVDLDPAFAGFLRDRLELAVEALRRERLEDLFGTTLVVDGLDWPAWLVADGADASSEAILGLSAAVAAGTGGQAREVLAQLSEGVAMMQLGTSHQWPYRALMPWTGSRTVWHAWGDQMSGALATAASVLDHDELLRTARREAGSFTPHLLAQGGPENGWLPTPIDRTQIAYGTDATLQNLLAVGDRTGSEVFHRLAAVAAAWYFGNNPAGVAMYDPATGRTFDGIDPGGQVNRNSGAESTIHGVLSMLALDARPELASWARVAERRDHRTWQVVEAESGTLTGEARVVTPGSAWTGEGQWSGGAYVQLPGRSRVTIPVELSIRDRSWVQVVAEREPGRGQATTVRVDDRAIGMVRHGGAGPAGTTPTEGYLAVTGRRSQVVGPGRVEVDLRAVRGRATARIDALLVQPTIERLALGGGDRGQVLLRSFDRVVRRERVEVPGSGEITATAHDSLGRTTWSTSVRGNSLLVEVPPGGFTLVRRH